MTMTTTTIMTMLIFLRERLAKNMDRKEHLHVELLGGFVRGCVLELDGRDAVVGPSASCSGRPGVGNE